MTNKTQVGGNKARQLLIELKPKTVLEVKDAEINWGVLRTCVAHDAIWSVADDIAAWSPNEKYDVGLIGHVLERFTVSDALFLLDRLMRCCNYVVLRLKRTSELATKAPPAPQTHATEDIVVYVYETTPAVTALPTIFINVASYKDDQELWATLTDAVAKAKHPERLRFAVVDQTVHPAKESQIAALAPAQIDYLYVDYNFSRGPCWARAVGFTLMYGEDYAMQIDSHMRFDPGWDTWFVSAIGTLKARSPKPYISMKPYGYTYDAEKVKIERWGNKTITEVPTQEGPISNIAMGYSGSICDHSNTLPGGRISAGCVFGPSELFRQVLVDPILYFQGEEHNFSVRAFTHGWDLFFVAGQPIFHLYNDNKCSVREPHWNEGDDSQRKKRWWDYNKQSNDRLKALFVDGVNFGAYGLGTVRTLQDYADQFGIDYPNMTVREGMGEKRYTPTPET
jgi:hypothetical protein